MNEDERWSSSLVVIADRSLRKRDLPESTKRSNSSHTYLLMIISNRMCIHLQFYQLKTFLSSCASHHGSTDYTKVDPVSGSCTWEMRNPSRNRVKIGFIALPKFATQRGFLDEDHKEMHHYPYHQRIADQQQ